MNISMYIWCLVILKVVISRANGEVTVSEDNLKVLEGIFKEVDKNSDGVITVDDVTGVLSVPAIAGPGGSMTEEEYFAQFLQQFERGGDVDGQVTLEEYVNSQANISSLITNKTFFYMLMRQKWRLS